MATAEKMADRTRADLTKELIAQELCYAMQGEDGLA